MSTTAPGTSDLHHRWLWPLLSTELSACPNSYWYPFFLPLYCLVTCVLREVLISGTEVESIGFTTHFWPTGSCLPGFLSVSCHPHYSSNSLWNIFLEDTFFFFFSPNWRLQTFMNSFPKILSSRLNSYFFFYKHLFWSLNISIQVTNWSESYCF